MIAGLIFGIIAAVAAATSAGVGIAQGVKASKTAKSQGEIRIGQRQVQGAAELGNIQLGATLSGIEAGEGSAALIRTQSEEAIETDVNLIRENADAIASAYKLQAFNAGLQGVGSLAAMGGQAYSRVQNYGATVRASDPSLAPSTEANFWDNLDLYSQDYWGWD